MRKSKRKFRKSKVSKASLACALAVLSLSIVVFGYGCGPGFEAANFNSRASDPFGFDNFGADDPNVISGRRTIGVPILSQSYASLVGTLQLNNPSTDSRNEFNRQLINLSETGRPDSIGTSFVTAYMTLAAQLCLDKVTQEQATGAEKVLFTDINLNAAPNTAITTETLSSTINRLARALWQRNETSQERQILIEAVNESMSYDNQNNANKTREAMLFLCTAMASSTSGLEM